MPNYQTLLYDVRERVCTITLNRPEKLNALSYGMRQELLNALKLAEMDEDIGCVVIKGAGKAFSAGYDITPIDPSPNRPIEGYHSEVLDSITGAYAHDLIRTWWVIWDLMKPVIAQVHGYCLAGGSELASMCDLMFVANDAKLGYPPIRAMSVPDTMYFPWKLPMSKAKLLLLTGNAATGEEAANWGWATQSFPIEDLEESTFRMAKSIASIAIDELALLKRAINRSYEIMGIRASLEVGADIQALSNFRERAGEFRRISVEQGLRAALEWRDGPFGDYSASK
ncbi:enoyl-CoA hydratase [SAR202 cluster bacterium AD-802-E10_MRT_200m]|nr:enoyl-CoA hydratase [SAR202 cluster bacterium AD-802-E10_MRT_200m]